MPIFDIKCPKCGHEWEALVTRSEDEKSELSCRKCGYIGKKLPAGRVSHKIFGFSAKNDYGLKKFDDGR